MEQYINRAVVLAEIERRINGLKDCHADTIEGYAGEISGLERLLSFLDTLEVKEVDLEKEMGKYLVDNDIEFSHQINLLDIAKHFYELGLKAQKGE